MLFRLLAVLIVMMAIVNEAFGKKKTTTTTTCNCKAATDAVANCLAQPAQKAAKITYANQMLIMDITSANETLTKLKKKCFSKPASLWNDIKCWIALNVPPPCIAKMYQVLTKAQKTTMQKNANNPDDKALAKKADAIWKVINDKYAKLSKTDKKKIMDWNKNYMNTCSVDYSDYPTT